MKKRLILSLIAATAVATGFGVVAQDKIIVKTNPVIITKEGETYVVPVGTLDTTTYYYYTDPGVGTRYVCTVTTPTDLSTVKVMPIGISVGDTTRNVNCYPESYFVIQP